MKGRAAVASLCSFNHLHRARVLADSLRRHHDDLDFILLLIDAADPVDPALLPGATLLPIADVFAADEVARLSARYEPLELCGAAKSRLLLHLFDQSYERLIYLDSDMLVLGRLDTILAELDAAQVLITPHLLDPIPLDGKHQTELSILRSGAYNSGFVAARTGPGAEAMLGWWASRTAADGYFDMPRGMFADQRWFDLVPGLFAGVKLLRHQGCNVAYWNLHSRVLNRRDDGTLTAGGDDLLFFHFSGFDPEAPRIVSRHQNRIHAEPGSLLAELVHGYAVALREADADGVSRTLYRFGFFSNGVPFTRFCRRMLRDLPNLLDRFPAPRDADGPGSFFTWLCEPISPAGGGIAFTRYVRQLYAATPALRARFADSDGRDSASWRKWLQDPSNGVPAAFIEGI